MANMNLVSACSQGYSLRAKRSAISYRFVAPLLKIQIFVFIILLVGPVLVIASADSKFSSRFHLQKDGEIGIPASKLSLSTKLKAKLATSLVDFDRKKSMKMIPPTSSAKIIVGAYVDSSLQHPKFDTTVPKTVESTVGSNIKLKCKVRNIGRHVLLWRQKSANEEKILSLGQRTVINDKRITVSHNDMRNEWSLSINNVRRNDSGVYACDINTNPLMSYYIDLTVSDKIDHADQLSLSSIVLTQKQNDDSDAGNITTISGSKASLRCQIDIDDKQTTVWVRSKDKSILTIGQFVYITDQRFTVRHDPKKQELVLSINPVRVADSGYYECQSLKSGKRSVVKDKMFLDVEEITSDETVKSNIFDGSIINSKNHHISKGHYETKNKISEKKRISSRSATYFDGMGSQYSSPPKFDMSVPQNVTAGLHSEALLNCKVEKLGEKTVSWIRTRDFHVLTVGSYRYTMDERFSVLHDENSDEWTLRISYTNLTDIGTYECQVSSDPKVSFFVSLNVVVPKTKIMFAPDLYVRSGSTIRLECIISQSPAPPVFVFWYHNDRMINYDLKSNHIESIRKIGKNTVKSVLLIEDAKQKDDGNYTCYPSHSKEAHITVHVLNGEKPAAMHDNDTHRNSTPRMYPISCFIFLTFVYHFTTILGTR